MNNDKYLIIGGGMTADAAAKGIREVDPQGTIALFSLETDPPYKRPLLSKGLWKGKPFDSVWRHTEEQQVTQYLGRKIVSLDPKELVARDDQGNEFHAEKILLATGGDASPPSFWGGCHYLFSHIGRLSPPLRFGSFRSGFFGDRWRLYRRRDQPPPWR